MKYSRKTNLKTTAQFTVTLGEECQVYSRKQSSIKNKLVM